MVFEGRLVTKQIGPVATVEFCTLAFSVTAYGATLGGGRLRLKIIVAGILLTLANIASAWAPYPYIILVRMVAGCCEGIAIWLVMQLFARSAVPARTQGLYISLLGASGFLLSAAYSGVVLNRFGSIGGFLGLAMLSALASMPAPLAPAALSPLPRGTGRFVRPTGWGFYGLISIFLIFAGTLGIWVYLPSFALQQHQPGWVIGVAVSFALAMQVVGGLTAASVTHLPIRRTLIMSWSACILLIMAWLTVPAPWLFVLYSGVFGFCWMFFTPFQSSLLVELDPSRRSLLFLPTADALGAGAGPALVSLAIVGKDVRGAFLVGALLFAGGLILLLLLHGLGERTKPVHLAVES
jgi:MFS family permease